MKTYIQFQHSKATWLLKTYSVKNKQSSQLLFVIIFCFATNAVHNVILPYHKTSSFIKLHFFYKYWEREREREREKENEFFAWQLYIYDDCADDFLTPTNIWVYFFDDFFIYCLFCHYCGRKLNQRTFSKNRNEKLLNFNKYVL